MLTKDLKTGSVKDVDLKTRTIVSYWASFDNVDAHNDVIRKGAFARTISHRGPNSQRPRIKFLWSHDFFGLPIGKPTSLVEDNHGLLATSQLSDTTLGRDIATLYDDGVITEHSIGFDVLQSDIDPTTDATVMSEIKLWEGSAVIWGANDLTPTVDVKGQVEYSVLLSEKMEIVRKSLTNSDLRSDELCNALDYQLSAWQKQLDSVKEEEKEDMESVKALLDGLKSHSVDASLVKQDAENELDIDNILCQDLKLLVKNINGAVL